MMNETPPPSEDQGPSQDASDALARAEAERRAAAVPVGGSSTGPYAPRDPSVPLHGPYPPAPYRSYPPYQPYPPSAPYTRGRRERQRVSAGVVALGSLLILLAILMACGFLFAGVLQGMAWVAQPAHATDTRTFTVAGTPTLTLDASAANVHILPGAAGQVSVTFTKEVHAITHAAAQQALDAISIEATQSGDTIRVTMDDSSFDGFPTWVNRKVELTVYVPASANLDLTISAGNVDVSGVSGTFDGRVSAGNLALHGMTISGDSSLHVSAGNVSYAGSLAPDTSFRVGVTAGNVEIFLPATTPTHIEASATAGNISVRGWPSVSTTRSGGGTITGDLNPQPTSDLFIDVTAGNVTVGPGA